MSAYRRTGLSIATYRAFLHIVVLLGEEARTRTLLLVGPIEGRQPLHFLLVESHPLLPAGSLD